MMLSRSGYTGWGAMMGVGGGSREWAAIAAVRTGNTLYLFPEVYYYDDQMNVISGISYQESIND